MSAKANLGTVFASPSAPSILIGVGSVDTHLNPYELSDTFMSQDGGLTWSFIQKGPYKHIIGDMGGIIVIIADKKPVDNVLYSTDRGNNWYFLLSIF